MSRDRNRDTRAAAAREDAGHRVDPALALCRACRRMSRAGLIAGRAGNLSLRDGERVLVTPRGVNKARLHPAQVVAAPLGTPAEQVPAASVEYGMHRACYLAAPGSDGASGDAAAGPAPVGAVVHTHAPALTALGLLGLDLSGIPEAAEHVGGAVLLPFRPSGSEALAEEVALAVEGGAGVLLLRGHGAVAVGRDLDEAADRMELAELAARAIVMARAAAPPAPPRPPRPPDTYLV